VEEYLRPQRRFAHLFSGEGRPDMIASIQQRANRFIRRFGLVDENTVDARGDGASPSLPQLMGAMTAAGGDVVSTAARARTWEADPYRALDDKHLHTHPGVPRRLERRLAGRCP